MESSPSERYRAREESCSVGRCYDMFDCKRSPVKRRNSRRKKGGLNFPLKHRVRDRRDSLKALFPGYFKFTIKAQREVRRQMDSVLMTYALGERASTWWISAADTEQHAWGAPRGSREQGGGLPITITDLAFQSGSPD